MRPIRPVSRSVYKRLVGALSTLVAEGTVNRLRGRAKVRQPKRYPPRTIQRFPQSEAAKLADDIVSNIEPPPGV